jgi:fucose 4-O-acetylase-like acetyltransferase
VRSELERPRNFFLDNARAVLIGLVIAGHALEPLIGKSELARTLYVFVYAFHMPAFAFISGYLSRLPIRWEQLARTVLLPYLALDLIYDGADRLFFGGKQFAYSPELPYWILWYLLALFLWRATLPLWARLPQRIPVSIGIGLAAGLSGSIGYTLSLSRVLVFLPFFLAGYTLAANKIAFRAPTARLKAVAAGVLLAGMMAAYAAAQAGFSVRWLWGSFSYEALKASWGEGMIVRGLLYAAACVLGTAMFALVPTREQAWSSVGRYSLYPFVLHAMVIRGAVAVGVFRFMGGSPLSIACVLVAAVLLTFVLSRPQVRRCVNWLVAPPPVNAWKRKGGSQPLDASRPQ